MMNGTNKKISHDTRELLHKWVWPDNVRELENAIEYAYYAAEEDEILPGHLQLKFTKFSDKHTPGGNMVDSEISAAQQVVRLPFVQSHCE